MSTTRPPAGTRHNIYLRNRELYALFRQAIRIGAIQADSVSERVETLMIADLRRVAPKLRKARVIVPEFVYQARPSRSRFP